MAWKRKVEELESDQRLLPDLIEAIRSGDNNQVESLINLIRSSTSHEELVSHLAANFPGTVASAEEDEARSKTSTRQQSPSSQPSRSSRAFQSSSVPIYTVPAKPWTTVTDDDVLVSHLLSLWFTWRHWWYPFVDRDALISSMQTGKEDDDMCTPALVNMILADACFDYDNPDEDNINASTEKTLQDLFYEEAKRHAESTRTKVSLPWIQFLAIQWQYLQNCGIERMATSIMQEMLYVLRQYDKPTRAHKPKTRGGRERVSGAQRILGYTSWAAFVSTTAATFAMRNHPLMEPPEKDKPVVCKGEFGEAWLPYPRDHPPISAHPNCHLHHLSTLFEICYNISQCLFVEDGPKLSSATRDALEELHRDLTAWYGGLPGCLEVAGVKAPHTLSVHAQYHWAVLVLSELTFTLQTDDEDDATVELLVPVVRAQHMTSALAIADLVHLQSVYWGVDHIPISFCEPINAALAVIIGDMEAADRKSSFVKLAVALHGLSRRSVAAESMLRMLRLTLRQRRLMSAKDVDQLFKDASDHWEASVLSPHVGVATASDATQFSEVGTTEETYDMLVEKWNQFNLGALSSSSSSSS